MAFFCVKKVCVLLIRLMPMKSNNSTVVISNQNNPHENLGKIVCKHFEATYQKPIARHTQDAFDRVRNDIEIELEKGTPLLFDSFCGTGMSTGILAKENPSAIVIGIDRSIARLSKTYNQTMPDNAILVQAECADFWFLAQQAGWALTHHSLFYPNPYPKSKQVKRRWHAHPAYPLLFALGGEVELRTNWRIYAEEFSQSFDYALRYLNDVKMRCKGVEVLCFDDVDERQFMTLFEKKYFLSGQALYRCKYRLH